MKASRKATGRESGSSKDCREPTTFQLLCYDILCQVPKGRVTTYQFLAKAMRTRGARAVGNALNQNPFAPKVPCHRVVKSDGSLGGFATGAAKKKALLSKEGIRLEGDKLKDFEKVLFTPSPIQKLGKRSH